ncbi:nephrin-like [Penaeus vannamei]|uniref:nephrin-like n=1 Tax=Penaeus vannamei TaxID=6689 RepID=UPI00387F81E8
MSLSSITLIAVREIDSNLQGNWGMNINDCSVDEGSGKPSEVGSEVSYKGRREDITNVHLTMWTTTRVYVQKQLSPFPCPGFERHVPGYPRYQYTGDPELGEHNLVIKSVTLTEDGEYQCQVGPTNDNPPIWAAANVTVLLAPSSVSIVGFEDGAVVEVVAGTSLTLECLVADARPAPEAVWYRGEAQVDLGELRDRVEGG